MAVKLSFDECKWLLECYWKGENAVEVQRRKRVEFGTPPPPTSVTIVRVWDKFEVDGTVQDVLKGWCGRKRSSTNNESADAVIQVLARSPKKSLRQCSHEIGIDKYTHQILQAQKWEPCIQRWMGWRGSDAEFPPWSPYLTPLDFCLWETLKNMVYTTKPQTLDELRDKIEHAINYIPLATIQTVCRSFRRRCWECTVTEGGHLEHVRT